MATSELTPAQRFLLEENRKTLQALRTELGDLKEKNRDEESQAENLARVTEELAATRLALATEREQHAQARARIEQLESQQTQHVQELAQLATRMTAQQGQIEASSVLRAENDALRDDNRALHRAQAELTMQLHLLRRAFHGDAPQPVPASATTTTTTTLPGGSQPGAAPGAVRCLPNLRKDDGPSTLAPSPPRHPAPHTTSPRRHHTHHVRRSLPSALPKPSTLEVARVDQELRTLVEERRRGASATERPGSHRRRVLGPIAPDSATNSPRL
ncbi:uncharacterized protein MONBRDRAFT_36411 [Monosiga brevicollis MX1]|uniref:Uncharacterized protein n=1 Tax=Monosiga brevicollis TaxID=81824 RepID=A9UUD2_MONBE|nr:uncharacterized protein MONBRDRAFT_36411 [Monosiga brevicollis MX1]EDQ91075.1 predicted protein [Monosiga brevicollis MX1]|eukprot:XP_001744372.1 hypothetical protein [Monosiga brevicollis MX1]